MYTVVCFGDTNTWGYDNSNGRRLPYERRWTGLLAKELGEDFRVVEEGLPGRATTEDPVEKGKNAREQITPCLDSHCPIDFWVMMLGQPDLKKRFSLTAYDIAMGVEELVKTVKDSYAGPEGKCPKILLLSPVQVGRVKGSVMERWFPAEGTCERSAELPKLYHEIAERYGADFLEASLAAKTAPDAIHIDNESHLSLARAIASIIWSRVDDR